MACQPRALISLPDRAARRMQNHGVGARRAPAGSKQPTSNNRCDVADQRSDGREVGQRSSAAPRKNVNGGDAAPKAAPRTPPVAVSAPPAAALRTPPVAVSAPPAAALRTPPVAVSAPPAAFDGQQIGSAAQHPARSQTNEKAPKTTVAIRSSQRWGSSAWPADSISHTPGLIAGSS